MNAGRISIPVSLSFLIIMFMTVIGCGKMQSTSVISGAVNGEKIEDVTINMTGGALISLKTDANGNYSFNSVENGYYTITPYFDGYSFYPVSTAVEINGAGATGINFTSKWVGYSIYGKVTGDVLEGVTLSLDFVGANIINVTSTTTDSDGKYTLTNTNIKDSSFEVKPSLAGYKFIPVSQSVSIAEASKTIDDFVSEAAHAKGSAKGKYTWDSSTGDLIITWTSGTVTAPCNWPKTGTEPTKHHTTISKTIMTWQEAVQWPALMIWTRTSSTENDPAGEWTLTDQSGNKYTATITATDSTSGSISLDENIIACAYAWSSPDFKVRLSYQDPDHEAKLVEVKGSGITDSQYLTYNGAGEWNTGGVIDISSLPTAPFTYTFTITDSGSTWEETSCFVDWPTNLEPTGTISTKLPTFKWTEIKDSSSKYMVQVRDSSYKLIWESDVKTGAERIYQGSLAFTSGSTYHYYVIVRGTGACPNGVSFAEGSFTYNP